MELDESPSPCQCELDDFDIEIECECSLCGGIFTEHVNCNSTLVPTKLAKSRACRSCKAAIENLLDKEPSA